ncbi:hypothetical protein EV646_101541 [Kribbella antiqua]|uniref:Uncharacterized protein n=1 Tax=Kribbella antiqua TaxID=2512217 RepID=A0A4V2S5C5_9ACTN|nr:hypothetical protein [Kribbella antiqua]TCO51550.1 hypothetical protein EV646_101541 [Kribbella antiqua]
MRTQAPRWYGLAARDAAYNVVYEALRQASDNESSRTGELLDAALPPATRSLDDALAWRRTYEITEAVLADNGMAHVYSTEAPDRLRGGRTPRTTAGAEAARGLVDGLAAASTQSRGEVFDSLLNHPKSRRWDLAFAMVAREHGPALMAKLASEPHLFTEVSKRADIEWGRLDSGWPRPGFEDAPDFGYAVGRDTARLLSRSASYLAGQEARTVSRELTPQKVFGGQAPFTSVQAPPSPPDVSTAPGQSPGTERHKPQEK